MITATKEKLIKLITRHESDEPVRMISCDSGLLLSVQAGRFAYSTPREDNSYWTNVEVGFPSERITEIMEYADDYDNPTDTVYAYVPIQIVIRVINKHGGLAPEYYI